MNIRDFVSKFINYPVLFIGTGLSIRYLEKSYTWDNLLKKVALDLTGSDEYYADLKYENRDDNVYKYDKIASKLEKKFNEVLKQDRNGQFKDVNDKFYEYAEKNNLVSRFKIYLSNILSEETIREDKKEEISEFLKIRKNIGSIITTNYDTLIEDKFEFTPLVGNEILMSNPYGSVYKIHGCVKKPSDIIITNDDYVKFDEKYELIRAQLLSLFIHNPIIFIGYNIGDINVKKILKTIFSYVDYESELGKKVRNNFLLVEYEASSDNNEIVEHDIDMDGLTIRINKIKTDNFINIYKALSSIHLPISAMDIRKVQNIVGEIYKSNDGIKVNITEDLDSLQNRDKILVIGSQKTIFYQYQSSGEMIIDYFKIIEESNEPRIALIDKMVIQNNQYFPIYGFSHIKSDIKSLQTLKDNQVSKLKDKLNSLSDSCKKSYNNIKEIYSDNLLSKSNKEKAIFWNIIHLNIPIDEVEKYLKNCEDKKITNYRMNLCAYDIVKYGDVNILS